MSVASHAARLYLRPLQGAYCIMELKEILDLESERTYSEYNGGEHLTFDPLKDLNLPSSYEEVVLRYKRLRGERQAVSLN